MSLREKFEKETKLNSRISQLDFIVWLEKRDEKREKLLSKERQAKEELLEMIYKLNCYGCDCIHFLKADIEKLVNKYRSEI